MAPERQTDSYKDKPDAVYEESKTKKKGQIKNNKGRDQKTKNSQSTKKRIER